MRRTILLLSATALAVMLLSGIAWAANITGDAGNDRLQGTPNQDNMDGKAGNDTLEGMSGGDSVLGGNGDDLLYGGRADVSSLSDKDEVRGQDGNDTVVGSSGADDLYGGLGNDAIYDALEDDSSLDRIYGGDGDDEIISVSSPAAKDEIVSCGPGRDVAYVDDLDVVATDCEEVRNAYADVSFSSPVPVAEALQIAEQTDSWVMTLEDDFVVGGEPMHDFYIGPSDTTAASIEQGYEQERLAFYEDMVNEHDDPNLTPEERAEEQPQIDDMEEALTSNNAGQVEITDMRLNGNEQDFQNLVSGTLSAASSDASAASVGNIEDVSIVGMSTNDERIEEEEALDTQTPSGGEAAGTEGYNEEDPSLDDTVTAQSGTWYPNKGRSKVAPSSIAGKRYVSQRFKWNNNPPGSTAGFCCGYEHDFKTQNGSGYHYLTGAQNRLCYPKNSYASTSYPPQSYRYLETNFSIRERGCERTNLTYTIGVANTFALVGGKQYFTFIRTPNGNAPKDNAFLKGELLRRVPAECYSVSCMFNYKGPIALIDTSTPGNWFHVPSTWHWSE